MAYTESELKAELYSVIPTVMQTEAEALWPVWFREASAGHNRDLAVKVKSLTFLLGKLWNKYNVQTGRDRKETFQQWQAVNSMLDDAKAELASLGGITGSVQQFAGVTNLRAKPLVQSCNRYQNFGDLPSHRRRGRR